MATLPILRAADVAPQCTHGVHPSWRGVAQLHGLLLVFVDRAANDIPKLLARFTKMEEYTHTAHVTRPSAILLHFTTGVGREWPRMIVQLLR
jgi:hypothetical protein